jgi:hypothetical protein
MKVEDSSPIKSKENAKKDFEKLPNDSNIVENVTTERRVMQGETEEKTIGV